MSDGSPVGNGGEAEIHYEQCVDRILAELGTDIRVALPLGLGKPVGLMDALYRRATKDSTISLQILTALSLEKPSEHDPIRQRLLNPVFDRLFGNYCEPQYLTDQRNGALPDNIKVHEFYFKAGSRIGNSSAQADYISSNYSHAARDVAARGANVLMQLVARDPQRPGKLSASCNPDTSAELKRRLQMLGRKHLAIAIVHPDLPYMYGDAELAETEFDLVMEQAGQGQALFPVPRLLPIPAADYAIGLNASTLVKDGGTLQLGIGAMGDAIVQSIILRDQNNAAYQQLLERFAVLKNNAPLVAAVGGTTPFEQGLYAATEMFVEGFLHLYQADILRRQVFDFWALQTLINTGLCDPQHLIAENLTQLAELGVRELRGKDFEVLQYHGFFRDDCRYAEGQLYSASGESCFANMANPVSQQFMAEHCLGKSLRNGCVLHGGFFLGSQWFYDCLREMPAEQRQQLAMCGVEKINQLDLNPRLFRAQRRDARFINTGLNITLNGAVASDTLENGQVVSGVGGQYNFVAMAHQLQPQLDEAAASSGDGRSVLMIRASRVQNGQAVSNILPQYGACTIPRHLRDIVVTEYGIADLRAKTDGEVAAALIEIADSRFQADLIKAAVAAGKLSPSYQLPVSRQQNYPHIISAKVAESSAQLKPYPFGCDFTEQELAAARCLKGIASSTTGQKIKALIKSYGVRSEQAAQIIARLGLEGEKGVKSYLLRQLIKGST
ncbi:acetyl-CoA hydrolase [Spongiibacter sp. KMU-158]|uniref:Acetyl-CoA hydrolase n=1 Tax=Spongiibacter pelagi TaxID=2760804 RepID=A0A927C1M6_9GAMM|nr:acetyl-CoA hydrolase/transferase C-terminal domain-containing protein [Spongiibacter pelagi]MBD2858518.1 acetyl-CoA hydrolase [Spongiibacter pelagi]